MQRSFRMRVISGFRVREPIPCARVVLSRTQVKAFNLRGLVAVLRRDALLASVCEKVSPATRVMIDEPPAANGWLDAAVLNEVYAVILREHGDAELRRLVRDSLEQGALVFLRPAVEAVLRLFGVHPATIFSRIQMFAGPNSRGYEWEFVSEGATRGVVRLTLPNERDVPRAAFVATAGVLEAILELCSTKGRVHDPEMIANGYGNAARLRVEWE
jgi:hypothetical protein